MGEDNMSDDPRSGMSEDERKDVNDLSAPRARIIYEVVRQQGDEELRRPIGSLFWSGLAAGITIMVSVITQGALKNKLPIGMPMRQVISDLWYSLGFLMVILGRMQLFTEQTIVTVLPNMSTPTWKKLGVTARLWAVVLVANILGSCIAAAINIYLHLTSPELTGAMLEVSRTLLHKAPLDILLQGIPAGFLIASIAWIRAGVSGGEFWVVLVLTYAIALGDFTHVVAGSAETFLLVFSGQTGWGHAISGIILPALMGNILGGTGLFALLAHAQVRQEI
jgi:formate/nitrite transporter FocA (FNT family)